MAMVTFLRTAKKKSEEEKVNEEEDQWTQIQKARNQNEGPRKKGKESKLVNNDSTVGKPPPVPQAVDLPKTSPNQFDVLSSDVLKEGEMQQLDGNELESEVYPVPHLVSQEQADPSSLVPP